MNEMRGSLPRFITLRSFWLLISYARPSAIGQGRPSTVKRTCVLLVPVLSEAAPAEASR